MSNPTPRTLLYRWISTVGVLLSMATVLTAAQAFALENDVETATQVGIDQPQQVDGGRYEGPLENGVAHGAGRLVWPSGNEYVGEFRHGMMHGEGKLTRRSGEVYEGTFQFGQPHGRGVLRKASGGVYEGEFRHGEMEGQGSYSFPSGSRYDGDFKAGEMHGKGKYVRSDGIEYEGDMHNDELDGYGVLTWPDGDTYEGGMKDGSFSGIGHLVRDGTEYTGSFRDGDFHGKGRWSQGETVLEGDFVDGDLTGQGRRTGADGNEYEGEFLEWTYQGQGVLNYSDGRRYEGTFENGQPSGQGKLARPSGARYKGEFESGRYHGQGTYTFASGKTYRGAFSNGKFDGEGELRWKNDDGVEQVATGTWQKGRYVSGDTPSLIASTPLNAEDLLAQPPALLRQALDRVAPSTPGKVDLFFLGFGGWGEQDVFLREVRFAEKLFAERFDTSERSLTLVNHRETLDSAPLATVTNLKSALRGLSNKMDADEDILFLFLTSHGSEENELAVKLEKLPLNSLSPSVLSEALEAADIPWRVVVASSCYSGGFIEPLTNNRTLVVSAAAADKTSFGCSDDAVMTYFGEAFLKDSIPQAESFEEAFMNASKLVAEREAARKYDPSEPQIAVGHDISEHLARWRAGLPESVPAAKAADSE